MHKILLNLFRVALLAFLLVGAVSTFGQAAGIAIGSASLMTVMGTSVAENAGVLASIAGILSFLQLYTREGKRAADDQLED